MESVAEHIGTHTDMPPRILIVDDEPGICLELEKIFRSSGYEVSSIHSSEGLFEALQAKPDLILLDIWMPGKDGMEVLSELQSLENGPSVIMMSGHATIATAVKATQMGAFDFIEKPLDIELLLSKVEEALEERSIETSGPGSHVDGSGDKLSNVELHDRDYGGHERLALHSSVFGSQPWMGKKLPQKTLKHSTILYGQGLHSGKKSGISLEPLPPDSGIHFVGVSGGPSVPAHVDYVESTGFATTLKIGARSIQTIEHLLSALHAHGISNLLVKCNEEVPVLDGSSTQFCNAINEVGICQQSGEWYAIKPPHLVTYDNGKERMTIEPSDHLIVEYELDYPAPLGKQNFTFEAHSVEDYEREIAPARTFGFVQDVGYLQAQGLAQGGRMDNFVLYGKDGAINQSLRFPNEAVRHKILDIIGDLYLLGRPLQAKITAKMTGHSDNVGLLQKIQQEMAQESL